MKTTEKQRYSLIRKYHTICGRMGMDAEQRAEMLIINYGVESSKELTVAQLIDVCDRLDRQSKPQEYKEMDQWRKRAIASIGGWLKVSAMPNNNIDYIKAIACRSTGCDTFNQIPKERLANLYYAFKNKQKDAENVRVAQAELLVLTGRMN